MSGRAAEAETALLGAVLANPKARNAVEPHFNPALFTVPAHQRVAEAICALWAARSPVDPVTVNAALADRGWLGGPDLPKEFAHTTAQRGGTPENAATYLELLADLRARRELKLTARKILSYKGSAQERIDQAARDILGIPLLRSSRCEHIGSILGRVSDEIDAAINGQKSERVRMYPSGFAALDSLIGGFRPGVLTVFAARPGTGKSALAVALADNLASSGVPVGVFWLEDAAMDFARRALLRRSQIPSGLMRSPAAMEPPERLIVSTTIATLSGLPIYVDDAHGITATELSHRMRQMSRDFGVRVFIVDHLGEIRLSREWKDRADLALGQAAKTFRDTAKDLDAVPILFSQMNRQVERRTTGGPPRMSDLDGSGQIEQAARFIGFLSRPTEGAFTINVAKNTFGPTKDVHLRFLEDCMSVQDGNRDRY